MEKDARYFLVGLFVSASLAALIGFLIWMMGPQDDSEYDYYTIHFTKSVSGLEEGANVEYKGVKAGKVIKLRLAPERSDLVRVDIGVDKIVPIRAGTKATLEMMGLTGLVRLELATAPGDQQLPPHPDGEKYPVLQGSEGQIFQMMQEFQDSTSEISSAAAAARSTAKSVQRLTDSLRQDPSRILYEPTVQGVEIAE